MITPKETGELEWTLGVGMTRFIRSPMGGMLERAELFGYGSDGKRIKAERWYPIVVGETADGRVIKAMTTDWSVMPVKTHRTEPSYVPNDDELEKFARTTRRLMHVEKDDPTSYTVLCLFFGDAGARWGSQKAGRIASIWAMTATGKRLLEELRPKQPGGVTVRDDEALVTDVDLQGRQPNESRRTKHLRMQNEALELFKRAAAVWGRHPR